MGERRSNVLLWLIVGGGAFLFVAVSLLALALYLADDESPSFVFGSNHIAVLDLEGILFDSKEFTEQLKAYGGHPGVKAVVVRLNSPGGGVAASQEIFEAVKKFRADTRKKVVVSMATVAASGAYYIACAADKVYANPGTITGSIGVIAEWYNYGDLLKWAKLEPIVIKSGNLKDAGSATRPLTPAERTYFQSLIDNMYGQFLAAVSSGRKMDLETVKRFADGRVFTGLEARSYGLIDEIGTLQDAIAAAAKMAALPGEPKVVSPVKKKASLWDILGDSRSVLSLNPDRSESHIRFAYLWR